MSYAYYRFFTGDYMQDTMHLGWYEDLAYRRLIDLYCLHGRPIRNDRAYIMRALRAMEPEHQAAVDVVLSEFFELKSDGWHQQRCDAELRWRRIQSDKGKNAVTVREEKRRNKEMQSSDNHTIIGRSSNQNQNHRSNPSCAFSAFDEFWKAYPRKKSKGQAQKAWRILNPDNDLCSVLMQAVSKAKGSEDWTKNNGQFIPYPASWLNARGWEDEVAEKPRLFPV